MERKKQLRNSAMGSYPKRNAGRNTQKSIYAGKSNQPEKSSSGDLTDLFKRQFSSNKNVPITYRAFEIIPRNSPYSHHFKALLNAESFIAKKEFQMALDIYQRMLNKIPVRSSREKMEQNIKDIESFLTDYDEPFAPKVQLDISYAGPPPGSSNNPAAPSSPFGGSMGAPGGASGGMSMPIQIQMSTVPPGQSGQSMPGQPMVSPQGMQNWSPNIPGGQQPSSQMAVPFGFFQAQAQAAQEQRDQSMQSQNKPFGFFDKVREPVDNQGQPRKASDDIEPANNTEKLLKELSEGIFQIEKAIFETNKMKVESEEEPEIPSASTKESGKETDGKPDHAGGASGSEEGADGNEPKGSEISETEPTGQKESQENEPEKPRLPSEEPEEEGIPQPPRQATSEEDESVSGHTQEPEEDLGEGILEKTPAIGSLDERDVEESSEEEQEKPSPIQEIRGVLELKEPEQEDTPFITITYDFTKIPHHFYLSKDHNILEYAYYKYKPMLVKAQRFIRKKQITKALNYYRVIRDQQIPDVLRVMVDKNIQDISEYLEKYLMARPG